MDNTKRSNRKGTNKLRINLFWRKRRLSTPVMLSGSRVKTQSQLKGPSRKKPREEAQIPTAGMSARPAARSGSRSTSPWKVVLMAWQNGHSTLRPPALCFFYSHSRSPTSPSTPPTAATTSESVTEELRQDSSARRSAH